MDRRNDPITPFEAGVMAALEVAGMAIQKLTGAKNQGFRGALDVRLGSPPDAYENDPEALRLWAVALERLKAGAELTAKGHSEVPPLESGSQDNQE